MTEADIAALATPDGERLLAQTSAELAHDPELAVLARLRTRVRPSLAAAAFTQVRLRARAVAKLGAEDAGRMLFTPAGLEQASRRRVAEHRAALVAERAPGAELLDLGCGIGADLIAFARAGLVVSGVDLDPVTAAVARHNLAALGLAGEVERRDVTATAVPADRLLFLDPARRDARGRVFGLDRLAPPWEFVLDLLTQPIWAPGRPGTCVKVGPVIPHEAIPAGVSAGWVSDDGTVVEAMLRSGILAGPQDRTATVFGPLSPDGATLSGDPAERADAGPVGRYLLEPDGAVIRAGLVGRLADRLDARLLDPHIAYLSLHEPARTPFGRCYRIIEELPFRTKQLRAELRARRVGRLTVKTRGVELDPAVRRRELLGAHGHGPEEATLVLTRVGGRGSALLVEPVGG